MDLGVGREALETVFTRRATQSHHNLRESSTGVLDHHTAVPVWKKGAVEGDSVSCPGHPCEPGASRQTQVGLAGDRQGQPYNPSIVTLSTLVITCQQRDSERGRHRAKDAQQLCSGSQECCMQLCIVAHVAFSPLWTLTYSALLITRTIQ